MPRYKLVVEYDGTAFAGWQRQAADRTVQQALEEAIERFVNRPVRVHCAGRTDAGVHASHQVVHLDLDREWRTDTVRDATNAHLRPEPVSVLSAARVGPDFDARHSALKRHYRYRILNRRSPPALARGYVWHVPWALDAAAMHAAAQTLLGRHDFSAFRAAECQASSPLRTLDQLDVERRGDEILVATSARSFLHHQVRGMVGTLMLAGSGRLDTAGVRAVLDSRDRARCGPLAPAAGLTLTGVDYPEAALSAPG
ncbi:tRNA pseudouridine(38-40) synthase TruA [Methylobacterium nodulans]|uniref:tRNA pseudouridine synthase A n=1 Tax=Methylobacterium nodulans (strain LMG 21967 / CNCM I-2342 / ORS 2060) TaxID=460265 RepID=TRUA_METNO|nr:tRNA pseudouridine(38-40) synthase TruA [Methylobacterium nodulans]B8IFQ2.1 RecName: Full=tRNA pseudouridine synthase A; AltName: Full=tRNA pseudouridine(38-40) synthase; AltName: Full=tRNA pseudouridylate synthase I; AltName: Full=tRNA-uridine isomerase I [Methylobacterium nodulans ORS 2060]ACL59612.1 tRNA pseudouridine synthase A [Methylobacterium nodulans ORS 2060]